MTNTCAFLNAGGNKVFFVNGVLKALKDHDLAIDHLIGFSSSSAILFAHKFDCHNEALEIFGRRLAANSRNFYFSRKMFPHTDIYKSSIEEMFEEHSDNEIEGISYSLIASQTSPRFKVMKGLCASLVMSLEERGINLINALNKTFDITPVIIDSDSDISQGDLINYIMGSSTIFPAIDLHEVGDNLILEGKLSFSVSNFLLGQYNKKINIHTARGETKVEDDTLHIYSSNDIPQNVLDYTSDEPIRLLHNWGSTEVNRNIDLIRNYLI